MSRSNVTDLKNPAEIFAKWSSDKKCFQYYNKETKETIDIPLPFRFLVLDCLSTVKGYSDADKSRFWSNEIRDLKIEELTVKTSKGTCYKGLYEGLAGARDCTGARYCQSVYAAIQTGDKLEIINISFIGSSLGQWIEFRKKNNVMKGAIEVSSYTEGKKGKTTYAMPEFKKIEITAETDEEAKKLDVILQEYLSLYLKKPKDDLDMLADIAGETFINKDDSQTDLSF